MTKRPLTGWIDAYVPEGETDDEMLRLLVTRTLHGVVCGFEPIDVDDEGRVTVYVTLTPGGEGEYYAVYVCDHHGDDPEMHRLQVLLADDGRHEELATYIAVRAA